MRAASPLTDHSGRRRRTARRPRRRRCGRGRSRPGGPGRRTASSASRPRSPSPRVQVPVASGKNASSHTAASSSAAASSPVGLRGFERHRPAVGSRRGRWRRYRENSGSSTQPAPRIAGDQGDGLGPAVGEHDPSGVDADGRGQRGGRRAVVGVARAARRGAAAAAPRRLVRRGSAWPRGRAPRPARRRGRRRGGVRRRRGHRARARSTSTPSSTAAWTARATRAPHRRAGPAVAVVVVVGHGAGGAAHDDGIGRRTGCRHAGLGEGLHLGLGDRGDEVDQRGVGDRLGHPRHDVDGAGPPFVAKSPSGAAAHVTAPSPTVATTSAPSSAAGVRRATSTPVSSPTPVDSLEAAARRRCGPRGRRGRVRRTRRPRWRW